MRTSHQDEVDFFLSNFKVTLVSRQPCTISGDRWLLSLHTHTHTYTHISCWKKKRKMQWALWKLLLLLRVGCCITSCSRVYYNIYVDCAHAKRHVSLSWFFATFVPLQQILFLLSSRSLFPCSFFSLSLLHDRYKKMRHGEMRLILFPFSGRWGSCYKIFE